MSEYFDAWVTIRQVTRERAEDFVRGLVEAGDIRRDQFEAWVEGELRRAEANTQAVVELVTEIVRTELARQLTSMGLGSRSDVDRLEAALDDLRRRLMTAAAAPAQRARKAAGKARRTAPAKSGRAKKATAKKTIAKKTTAKKTTGKTTAKRAAKKSTAKRAAKRSASPARKSR